jgi:hypothetical protein
MVVLIIVQATLLMAILVVLAVVEEVTTQQVTLVAQELLDKVTLVETAPLITTEQLAVVVAPVVPVKRVLETVLVALEVLD